MIIVLILIIIGGIFSFLYLGKVKNYVSNEENIPAIDCNQLMNYYKESFNKIIDIKVYLLYNCTINGITIPSGYRIIYIYQGNISYI
ncbi:MAG: hypothetical protein ACP5G1_01215 [Nanopusillaceae archaeon]